MRTDRFGQITTGLVAGIACLALLTLPAAANTVGAAATAGQFQFYDEFGGRLALFDLDMAPTGTLCAASTGAVTTTGSSSAGPGDRPPRRTASRRSLPAPPLRGDHHP